MEALLIFVTILAVVSSRNILNTDYELTKEELDRIFGSTPPNHTKPTAVDIPASVPNDYVFSRIEKTIMPYEKKTSNELNESETPKTVELNIQIQVNDCDKKGSPMDKNINSTDNGTKMIEKQNPGKGNPEIHSRIVEDLSSTDDRMSLDGGSCPSDKVKLGNTCVIPD